jgi:guanine deaminase
VQDGRVITEAVNTVTRTNDPTAHAEINAIRAACLALESFTLQGCEIYTSSEPCPMCLAAIYWAHMDRIYYGNTVEDAGKVDFDDAFLYRELVLSHADRSIPCQQLLGAEAWESFEAWQESEHKIDY